MLAKLQFNLSQSVDKRIDKTYANYKRFRLKALDKEISRLVAQEKALFRKLAPVQAQIQAKKREKTKLGQSLAGL